MVVLVRASFVLAFSILFAIGGVDAQIQPAGGATGRERLKVEGGTRFSLELAEPISSATAKKGQTVRLKMTAAWIANGNEVLPKGSEVLGRVASVRHAVPGKQNGRVVITSGSMRLRSGRTVALNLSMPDRDECDGARVGCALSLTVFAVVASPILAIEVPIWLIESPRLIRGAILDHRQSRISHAPGTESALEPGALISATTKRTVQLKSADIGMSSFGQSPRVEPAHEPIE